jgi:hypothetical protein
VAAGPHQQGELMLELGIILVVIFLLFAAATARLALR